MSKFVADRLDHAKEEFEFVPLTGADGPARDATLAREGAGIRALLCAGMERLDAERLALLPDLELIAIAAGGMAGVDLGAARRRGIAVTNAGAGNADDVADFAATLYLAHRREILANHRWVAEDYWLKRRRPEGRSIRGDRVGIVGLGRIGEGIAGRLAPFGCELAWYGPRDKAGVGWRHVPDLLALARWANVLIVAVRADASTRHLIDGAVLDALGPDGLIVNVARGFVIDEQAMLAALRDGRLGGAALDVFEREPVRGSEWADVPGLLLAPHVGGGTRGALDRLAAAALDNVRALYAGAPLVDRVV